MPSVSRPSRKILPEVGGIRRLIIFIVVVLPQPDGPGRTQTSPAATSMVTASTAVIGPKSLLTRSRRIMAAPLGAQAGRGEPAPRREEGVVGGDCEEAHGKRAGQKLADVGLRDAARDEGAEPAGAD